MSNSNLPDIDLLISDAIRQNLGNIDTLPHAAQIQVKEVYLRFFSAYLKISDLKRSISGDSPGTAIPLILDDLDPDIVGYMQHFFSDYQDLYRDFMVLNRRCRQLLQIDGNSNPQAFKDQLQTLLSGTNRSIDRSILNALLSPQDLDERP